MTEAELLKQEGVITEQIRNFLRTREWRDWVSLESVGVRLRDGLVRGRDAPTVFPMTRTGVLRSLGLYGGSLSTERAGHPYEM